MRGGLKDEWRTRSQTGGVEQMNGERKYRLEMFKQMTGERENRSAVVKKMNGERADRLKVQNRRMENANIDQRGLKR